MLVSTESGGEGRNLQFCRALLNYDLPWNPMRIEQRIGRISRIGQRQEVLIFNLSAADTVEQTVLELLDAKINLFELVVGEVGMILGRIDEERPFEEVVLDHWLEAEDGDDFRDRLDALGDRLTEARRRHEETVSYEDRLFGVSLAGAGAGE